MNTGIVDVILWGKCIGKLQWDNNRQASVFQFSNEYFELPFDICPITHPKGRSTSAFYGRTGDIYRGLPEFISDSLPDKWGTSLFDHWMNYNHIKLTESTPLLQLSYIGKRAMGALEFVPEYEDRTFDSDLDFGQLAKLAAKVYQDRQMAVVSPSESLTLKKLIYLGTSAGGKRPKAVIAYNQKTGEFRSGQVELDKDFKQYLVKFKEDPSSAGPAIEMIYYKMATKAGITMMPSFLKDIEGQEHFFTERFDRQNGDKIFTQTLAAIMPGADDYMKFAWLSDSLNLPQEDRDQLFLRMVFNYYAGVTDDHNKNFSFIMKSNGVWRISPAYDVTFTANTWDDSSSIVHSLGVMGKHSHLTLDDFVDFAQDFVNNPKEKIEQVLDAVHQFDSLCLEYGVDSDIRNKINTVLSSL